MNSTWRPRGTRFIAEKRQPSKPQNPSRNLPSPDHRSFLELRPQIKALEIFAWILKQVHGARLPEVQFRHCVLQRAPSVNDSIRFPAEPNRARVPAFTTSRGSRPCCRANFFTILPSARRRGPRKPTHDGTTATRMTATTIACVQMKMVRTSTPLKNCSAWVGNNPLQCPSLLPVQGAVLAPRLCVCGWVGLWVGGGGGLGLSCCHQVSYGCHVNNQTYLPFYQTAWDS